MKIVGRRFERPYEVFCAYLSEAGFTAASFVVAFDSFSPGSCDSLSLSSVQSFMTGRRNLSACKADVLRRIVILLCPGVSSDARWNLLEALCHGRSVPVYESD